MGEEEAMDLGMAAEETVLGAEAMVGEALSVVGTWASEAEGVLQLVILALDECMDGLVAEEGLTLPTWPVTEVVTWRTAMAHHSFKKSQA
mmetsp:Transcript_30237/g.63168  ORF Transcript_30237/g.63168 Transcript_30237/m.63168 type:complete len:90 (+) Transcript_30237:1961-2230(+)